jgi:hypothetical protein
MHAMQKETIPKCAPALELTLEEMNMQMNLFSRTFDKIFFSNAWEIFTKLKEKNPKLEAPKITTWELYDRAFTFQRVRKYSFVIELLNKLEQFEDNANLNLSNTEALINFVNSASEVQKTLTTKYGDAFKDPAKTDPRKAGEKTEW